MTEEPDTMEPNTAIKQLHDLASIDIPSTRHMALEERVSGIMVMLDDLSKLARNDGCVAAAWALEMIESLQKQNTILEKKNSTSLANNLCPDHRDKQAGKPCLACTIETLEGKYTTLQEKVDRRGLGIND